MKSGRLNSPFFFKIVLAILGPLPFHRTFKIILSTYTNVLAVILITFKKKHLICIHETLISQNSVWDTMLVEDVGFRANEK